MDKPTIIAIAGASCSGKSTVAKCLSESKQNESALLISIDDYIKDFGDLPIEERCRVNFDEPDSVEHQLLVKDVALLLHGETVNLPRYNFESHRREITTTPAAPNPLIIIEGIFGLYWQELRELCDTLVFVDAPHNVCLERRVARDVAERGRTAESVRERYHEVVQPMFEFHVAPTKEFASVVVNGVDPIASSVKKIRICCGN